MEEQPINETAGEIGKGFIASMEDFFGTWLGGLIGTVLLIVGTILIAWFLVRWINRAFRRMTERIRPVNPSNATLIAFLRYPALFAVYFAAFAIIVSSIPPLNAGLNKMLAAGGVLAVVLGVAGQQALSSVASGIMILAFHPFAIGDVVNVVSEGVSGTVEDITLRHTVLRTFENKRVIVPNSTMNNAILENFDYGDRHVCLRLEVGITYESDVDRALALLAEVVGAHPDYLDTRSKEDKEKGVPRVIVRVAQLADSAVVLRAMLWGKDNGTALAMQSDLMRQVKQRFEAEGIDLAYPHLVIVNK